MTTNVGTTTTITGTTIMTDDTATNINPHGTFSGDFNGDGEVSVADAVLLMRFATEDKTLTKKQVSLILNAEPDQDADGLVTISDVLVLLKKIDKN